MTLFADAVSCWTTQFRRVDYVRTRRMPYVFFARSVASLARDRLYVFRNEVASIRIIEASAGCMAIQARLYNASIEVQNALCFVTGRDIPAKAVVPGQRRLKEIVLHLHQ